MFFAVLLPFALVHFITFAKLIDEAPEPWSEKPVASSSKHESLNTDLEADAKLTAEKYAKGEFKRTKRPPID